MSEPRRILCRDSNDIPSPTDLLSLADQEHHVVLMLPAGTDKESLIVHLASDLPDHSVFDSGGDREGREYVTVKKVIDRSVIAANADAFLEAVRQFTDTAVELVIRLANKLGRPVDDISERWRFDLPAGLTKGQLDKDWEYLFHGYECRFLNRSSGQDVDVKLQNWGNPKALLDPFFFARFVRSTPSLSTASSLLSDTFHDPHRVLEILAGEDSVKHRF